MHKVHCIYISRLNIHIKRTKYKGARKVQLSTLFSERTSVHVLAVIKFSAKEQAQCDVVYCLMLIADIKSGCSHWHAQSTEITQTDHLSSGHVVNVVRHCSSVGDTKMETAKTSTLWVKLSVVCGPRPVWTSNARSLLMQQRKPKNHRSH